MSDFILKEVSNIKNELEQIGFDSSYLLQAENKFRYKNIKIFNLSVAQANILKQTALIFGADCAVNRNVITGNIAQSDVILCGSYSQLKKIASKLMSQPFKLAILGKNILNFLEPQVRKTKLVGILNVTPDSFSDGGKYLDKTSAENHFMQLLEDGADLIDIGAESTRPNSEAVSCEEQIERLKSIIEFAQKENLTDKVSVDTRSSEVADFVLNHGIKIINDVSGFDYDKKMPDVIAKYQAGVIIQHSTARTEDYNEFENIMETLFFSLKTKAESAQAQGITNIIIDPGIGFGKNKKDNFIILDKIEELYSLELPIMVGVSRKSLLGVETDDNELKDSLSASISYPLIQKGVDYLRVHNIKLHKALLNMYNNFIDYQ